MIHAQRYSAAQAVSNDELIQQHGELVRRIAYHLAARLPASVLVEDLIQVGMVGLLDAARQYDPSQGAAFQTYATIRIRGAMLDELRRNDWAPKSVHRKARELEQAIHRIESRTGRDARAAEIIEELSIDAEEYHRILQDARSARVLNFQDLGLADAAFQETLPDAGPGPLEGLESAQFRQRLAEAIAGLPERERMVVGFYYDNEFNLKEIGRILGVSESRISQLLSQAHLRLRARMGER